MVDEQFTDGMSGKDVVKKHLAGSFPHPQDNYEMTGGPGSTSLQDKTMNTYNRKVVSSVEGK